MLRDRMLSTWDHSTNWIENVFGGFENGVANHYGKEPEWFLADYESMVDWCAEKGVGAIGIRGLLRDRHHDYWDPKRPANDMGVVEARRLCAYARERNVRIVLMAGLFDEGGVYYESGNYGPVSEWSLDAFLARHPECQARDLDGALLFRRHRAPFGHYCKAVGNPQNRRMRQYALDSVEWVTKAIPELGGVQFDFGPSCEGREEIEDSVVRIVRSHVPDAWIVNEATEAAANPGTHNLMRIRKGTLWNAAGRDELALESIRRDCRLAAERGMDGVVMEAGSSPHRANAELNYLAFCAFAREPSLTVEGFVRTSLAPLLGGELCANMYVELAGGWRSPEKVPAYLREIAAAVSRIDDVSVLSRWFSLADFLRKVRVEAEMGEHDKRRAV